MRKPLIAGNWKMNGSAELVETFGRAFAEIELPSPVDVVIHPPFPYLDAARRAFADTPLGLGAQTLNPLSSGARTGEVSGQMLGEFGVEYVLIGHSERRQLFQESDEQVYERVVAALQAGISPILCVGETLEERDAGHSEEVVLRQVGYVMARLEPSQRRQMTLAYEPVWAIGTGRTATPEQAQQMMAAIRAYQAGFDRELAESLRLLYGGSMSADNARALLAQQDIDGGLIGGASLKVDDFIAICQSAG
ncbi:triose-phosphate isomerase [Salinicola sp. MH3R3-1]|uniref:triose-phosphate isomerase n=1 Tax=Salinicola sp. MH3R3-1 TaxID=1928762 RepID=UPI00094F011F|nr:triose-phosphate isomerase [Salinicola sp. MH3R3-1]OLO09564.1 triose-phosphate isomerase [Salinicola sp. MH3R3-1]